MKKKPAVPLYKKRMVDLYLNDRFLQLLKDYIPDINLQGNCFCPFHDDNAKPSAKVYNIIDGESFIYCYRDRHVYKSSDILLRYDERRFESEFKNAFRLFGTDDLDVINFQRYNEIFCSMEYTKSKLDFRGHRITLKDYIDKINDMTIRKEKKDI